MRHINLRFLLPLLLVMGIGCKKEHSASTAQGLDAKRATMTASFVGTDASGISISGTKFLLNGSPIFFNGINAAWQSQPDHSIDYLGRNFNATYWNAEFQKYVDNHINFSRVWVHCRGDYSPSTNGDGSVLSSGASAQFWSDMDQLVSISRAKKVYIMPTIWSFDMVKSPAVKAAEYVQIINDVNKSTYYINNFLIPFVKRYNAEPYVMGYDLCNEPEHMWGGNYVPHDNVIRFFAMCAAAIHQNSTKVVTIGASSIGSNSSKNGGFNEWSNSALQSKYANSAAYVDFYSPHWYAWFCTSAPFTSTLSNWMDDTSKPVIIGETNGEDLNSSSFNNSCGYNITLANYYNSCYLNGYSGVAGWKNPDGDGYGTFNEIIPATNNFYSKYPSLVYPAGQGGGGPIVSGGTYEIVSRNSGKVAEVYGGTGAVANGTNVQQYTYLNQTNQQWVITSVGGGYYTFAAKNSGRLMEVYNRSTADGANVSIWDNVSGTNQQWSLVSVGSGYYELVNRNSGKALDVSGGLGATGDGVNIDQYGYGGGANQQWSFVRVQ